MEENTPPSISHFQSQLTGLLTLKAIFQSHGQLEL